MNKFFVVMLAIAACLVSGCTLPPEGHPPPNYRIIFVNETKMNLMILENNIRCQEILFPNQQQVLEMSVDDYRTIELGYRILAFNLNKDGSMGPIVATVNHPIRVIGNRSDIITRMFVVKYSGGNELRIEEK
jgi:hypothetical protein